MNQYEITRSIYHKVIAKCPQGTYLNALTTTPNSNFPLRNKYGVAWCSHGNETVLSENYITSCGTNLGGHVRFLNFNTEQERYNAWQSYLTKFARFCICMDESTKLAPYMSDYTQPWDDQRFYEYFELSDIEWQLIQKIIKW